MTFCEQNGFILEKQVYKAVCFCKCVFGNVNLKCIDFNGFGNRIVYICRCLQIRQTVWCYEVL